MRPLLALGANPSAPLRRSGGVFDAGKLRNAGTIAEIAAMPLKITYWTESRNKNIPGAVISAESLAVSGTSARSGATPANAVFVSIRNTETGDVNFDYSGTAPTAVATTDSTHASAGIGTGERLFLDAVPGNKIAAITSA